MDPLIPTVHTCSPPISQKNPNTWLWGSSTFSHSTPGLEKKNYSENGIISGTKLLEINH